MLFFVRFTDHADRLDVRQAHLAAHMAWLAEHADAIRLGGPLRESPEANPVGAMWLVEAADRAAVEALIATDPFWTHGLRASREILEWRKAVPPGPATIG
ncbi:MAG: YciI family protein [Candidatus Eisenbacteria bacterium]